MSNAITYNRWDAGQPAYDRWMGGNAWEETTINQNKNLENKSAKFELDLENNISKITTFFDYNGEYLCRNEEDMNDEVYIVNKKIFDDCIDKISCKIDWQSLKNSSQKLPLKNSEFLVSANILSREGDSNDEYEYNFLAGTVLNALNDTDVNYQNFKSILDY